MSILTFDELVSGMVAQGVPKARAEAVARRELGMEVTPGTVVEIPGSDALEDVHVEAADKLVRALGGHVVRNSQKRASKVTPGIPDRMYFFPRNRRFLFWEAKRVGGTQSTAQKYFEELCDACDADYLVGHLGDLTQWLEATGIATREADGSYTPNGSAP